MLQPTQGTSTDIHSSKALLKFKTAEI